MRKIQYILIILVIFGCNQLKNEPELKGDWLSIYSGYPLIITDSTIGIFGWGDFQKYWIKNNTIFFETRDKINPDYSYLDSAELKPMIIREVVDGTDTLGKFKIKNDTLILSDLNWTKETVKYFRLKKLSNIEFDSLFFKTSMCHGICPSMEIKINSDGDFYFKGKGYTEKNGNYKGKLSQVQINLINDKINLLNFDIYDSAYFAGYTDGQTRNIILYHDGIREYLQVYGSEEEPVEINVLFHYLSEFYKWTDLQKLEYEQKFEEIEKMYRKPPPPPPPTKEITNFKENKIDE